MQEVDGSNPSVSTKKSKSQDLDFFIHCESNGISSRASVYIIAEGVYHQPKVVCRFRNDDIQGIRLDLLKRICYNIPKGSDSMKNEYKITKNLMKSWAKEYHLHGAKNVILFITWCILGIVGIAGLIISIELHIDWLISYLYALVALIAFYKLFIARFVVYSKGYKLFSSTYGVAEWIRSVEFLDDEIVLTDHTTVNKFKYENIEKIKEKNNDIIVFMKHNLALRLYKDAFVEGTWQECKEKILEKKKD